MVSVLISLTMLRRAARLETETDSQRPLSVGTPYVQSSVAPLLLHEGHWFLKTSVWIHDTNAALILRLQSP